MPRLTTSNYSKTHHQLKQLWFNNPMAYGLLTANEQWQLHDYFRPSHPDTEPQLQTHRADITLARPSLPQQAGKALRLLESRIPGWEARRTWQRAQPAKRGPAPKDQHLIAHAIVNPEVDIPKLAHALMQLAEQQAKDREQAA